MKKPFQIQTQTDTGRAYWRSLDELAQTPEFEQWIQNEFPQGASELSPDFNRRDFVKLMSSSFLLAGFGLTGCRRPEEHIYPFAKKPENYTHGVPQYYATAMPVRDHAMPLLVKANEGRPTKIEGNPDFPGANGGTNAHAQASILDLYDADRSTQYLRNGLKIHRAEAEEFLNGLSQIPEATRGRGLCLVLEKSGSPSRKRLLDLIRGKYSAAVICEYEPVDDETARQTTRNITGRDLVPYYKLDEARVLVSLDSDFLGAESDHHRLIGEFAKGRKIETPDDPINRLYAVEGLMTLTGINADHRLRVPSGSVVQVAAQLAAEVLIQVQSTNTQLISALKAVGWAAGVEAAWVTECAKDLIANKGHSTVLAGYRQPMAVHAFAQIINHALENVGVTVLYKEEEASQSVSLAEAAEALRSGQIRNLVICGGNPAYNAPADIRWSEAAQNARDVARLGYWEDETSRKSHYQIPMAHYLESWGDARTVDGVLVGIQPLIKPLFDGMSELELLARIAGLEDPSPHSIVRETFESLSGDGDKERQWQRFLHDGFLEGSASSNVKPEFNLDVVRQMAANLEVSAPSVDSLEIVFYRDYSVDDGRFGNNGWMQEMPDPVTKMTWDNAVLVSRKTAAELGVENYQVVRVQLRGRTVEGPIWVQPGLADYTLGLALGYGRTRAGRVGGYDGTTVGFDAYGIRLSTSPYIASGAMAVPQDRKMELACTQDHWSMEGRAIVREGNLSQFKKKADFAQNMDLEAHTGHIPLDENGQPKGIYQHPYQAKPILKSDVHQWGMTIDLNACVGCSACVIACQSENNIPIVGKKQVANSREMHWMRIDRYYSGPLELRKKVNARKADAQQQFAEWIDDPQCVTQPMLCQHCESAPCESVCPVNATVHDREGLNLMAYNRCVGTRYCSNNCPYKVRRFNFFDYTKRPIDKLYQGPFASRSKEELDLIKLAKNPDVSVRMRGVMEKCSFCVQRIEQGKIAQLVKAGASDAVQVPDGAIETACQQACPAQAIAFGNLMDPESRVSKLKKLSRNYSVLGFLDTRPRTTYLARVRNPNPAMPDYYEMPLSLQEYSEKMGNPTEEHHSAAGEHAEGQDAATGHAEEKGAH